MANMRMDKNPMPEQDPILRTGNFNEVALGYSAEAAVDEARRCLNCPNSPCRGGCPVSVRIPEFIAKVSEGDFEAAYEIITSTNALPAICGRVCPQEKQCQSFCTVGKMFKSPGDESPPVGNQCQYCAEAKKPISNTPASMDGIDHSPNNTTLDATSKRPPARAAARTPMAIAST